MLCVVAGFVAIVRCLMLVAPRLSFAVGVLFLVLFALCVWCLVVACWGRC